MLALTADIVEKLGAYGHVVACERRPAGYASSQPAQPEWSVKSLCELGRHPSKFAIDVVNTDDARHLLGASLEGVTAPTVIVKQTMSVESLEGCSGETMIRVASTVAAASKLLAEEAAAMEACQGPRIAKLFAHGSKTSDIYLGRGIALRIPCYYLVMHHYVGGDMFSLYVEEGAAWTEEKRLAQMKEHAIALCQAVAHVHKCGYIHRDIKPENIFVEDGLFLGDFGFAKRVDQVDGLECEGTLIYMAPEVAQMHKSFQQSLNAARDKYFSSITFAWNKMSRVAQTFSTASDAFALGATMHNSFAKSALTDVAAEYAVAFMGIALQHKAVLKMNKDKLDQSVFKVVQGLLEPMADKRMTIDQAMGILA